MVFSLKYKPPVINNCTSRKATKYVCSLERFSCGCLQLAGPAEPLIHLSEEQNQTTRNFLPPGLKPESFCSEDSVYSNVVTQKSFTEGKTTGGHTMCTILYIHSIVQQSWVSYLQKVTYFDII
jgi:hypothetical protein